MGDDDDADEENTKNVGEDEQVEEESPEQHLSLPELRGSAFTGSNFPASKEWGHRIRDLKDACFETDGSDERESQRRRCVTVADELNEAADLFSGLSLQLRKAADSTRMYIKPVHRALMWPKPVGMTGPTGHVHTHLRNAAALNRRIAKIHLARSHELARDLEPVGKHYFALTGSADPLPRHHAPTDPALSVKEAGLDGMIAPWARAVFLASAPAQASRVLDVHVKRASQWGEKLRTSVERRDDFL